MTAGSNHPAAGKAGIPRLLQIKHHCPGLPEPGRWATMRHIPVILALSSVLMLVGCSQASKTSTTSSQKSVEQRVADLEQFANGGAPPPNAQDLNKQSEQDSADISSLGLVDRAHRDFANRVPGAAIENFRISYFKDTNVVWCSVTYKPQGGGEPRGQDFGYKRNGGTNWNLIWNDEKKP
jgi:hypothetical protein